MPPAQDAAGQPSTRATDWAWVALASLLVNGVASLPYFLAYSVRDHVFTGILVNPADGTSYLAKMMEGWRGDWLFTLPYTAEPGSGALIYTYYLFLGHLARWTGLSLELVYHLAQAAGGLALLLTAYFFVGRFVPERRWRLAIWLLFALSSGLGWLAVPFGGFTSDLWVAEAIPFLAVFTNAHFALVITLQLWIFLLALPGLAREPVTLRSLALLVLVTTLEAQVQPLALLTAGLTLAGVAAWHAARRTLTRARLLPVLLVIVCSAPWVVYDAYLSYRHPILSLWSAQNLTPAPPLWDLLLSGGALLLLAVPGAVIAARRRSDRDAVLLIWLGLGVLAMYAPFALQRRLALGLWMPLALLAGIGLRETVWPRLKRSYRPLVLAALAVLVLPSNLLVYAATLGAVAQRDPAVFITLPESAALDWLSSHARPGAIVAASPQLSLFIPARTSARVIYGHPFETVGAAAHLQAVKDFYAGRVAAAAFVETYHVEYVLVGPSEQRLGAVGIPANWRVEYQQDGLTIYAP